MLESLQQGAAIQELTVVLSCPVECVVTVTVPWYSSTHLLRGKTYVHTETGTQMSTAGLSFVTANLQGSSAIPCVKKKKKRQTVLRDSSEGKGS